AFGRVDRAEAIEGSAQRRVLGTTCRLSLWRIWVARLGVEKSRIDSAARDLARPVPAAVVGNPRYGGTRLRCGVEGDFPEAVVGEVILRILERTVGVVDLSGEQILGPIGRYGATEHVALGVEEAARRVSKVLREFVLGHEVERARVREVAVLC